MTLEELIAEANDAGLWVNNLAQSQDGVWKANVVRYSPNGLNYWEFAEGVTAAEALHLAIDKTKEQPKQKKTIPLLLNKPARKDNMLRDLLNEL